MRTLRWSMLAGLLGFLSACGGGGGGSAAPPPAPPAPKATGLTYSDPAGSGFRLLKDASSTSARLILRLVGPAGTTGRGVSFTLAVDPALADLVKVNDGDPEYVQNGDVFLLGSAPQLLKGVRQNGTVFLTVTQKGSGPARPLDGTLLKVAIQFKASANLGAGTSIPLALTEGQYLPASGGAATMTVSAGALTAQ